MKVTYNGDDHTLQVEMSRDEAERICDLMLVGIHSVPLSDEDKNEFTLLRGVFCDALRDAVSRGTK